MTLPAPKHLLALALLWMIVFALTLPMNPPSFTALLVKVKKGETLATITKEADPNNHRYLTFQYVVDGKTFSGVGYGPDGKEMALGEQVRVYYFPDHPQYATIASDKDQSGYLKDGVMSGISMATFLTFVVYWKYFKASNKRTVQTTP